MERVRGDARVEAHVGADEDHVHARDASHRALVEGAAAAAAARVDLALARGGTPAGVERRARELAAAPEEALEHRRGLRGGRALRAIRAEEEEAKHAVAAAGETRAAGSGDAPPPSS